MNVAQTQNRIFQLEDIRNDALNEIDLIEEFGEPCELYFMYKNTVKDCDEELDALYAELPPYLGPVAFGIDCPEFDFIPF